MSTFHTHYISTLEPAIARLNKQRKTATIAGFICRIFELYFVTMVVSLFLGFLDMFSSQDGVSDSFFGAIRYFMYFVLTIVVVGLVNSQVKKRLGEIDPKLALNNTRVSVLTLIFSAIAIGGGYLIGTLFLGSEFGLSFMLKWMLAIGSVFVFLGPYFLLKKLEDRFTNHFKETLFSLSLPSIDKTIQYQASSGLTQQQFVNSKLFTYQRIDTFKSRDYFANADKTFEGSYLDVMQIEQTQSNGKSETKYSQLFKGYLFVTDFNKQTQGETYVFPDSARMLFGENTAERINELIHRPALQLAIMEDPVFEKLFAVYSTDAVEARFILSPKLIERITELKQHFYQDIHISFIQNKIYLAISSPDDLFAPGVFTDLHNEANIEKFYERLRWLITFPEQFDLSTRVWR